MKALLLSAAIGSLFLTACSSSDDDTSDTGDDLTPSMQFPVGDTISTSNFRDVSCGELLSDELVAAGVLAEPGVVTCGELSVPEDWDTPAGRMITLAVYKVPATTDSPAADPVVYLEGGPGGAGVGIVPFFVSGEASYLRERSDVYVLDQRGTGYSTPALYCTEVYQAEAAEDTTDETLAAAFQACHDRFTGVGVDFSQYNSVANARDVEAMRIALGIDQWNLYGLSYGTRLALTVMRDQPANVRSVVLDSVFPPEVNGLSESAYPYYWAVEQISINCAADDDCTANVGDVKASAEAAIARLEANPVDDLTADAFIQAMGENIANPQAAAAINTVANGSEEEVRAVIAAFSDDDDDDGEGGEAGAGDIPSPAEASAELLPLVADVADAMYFAVVCGEEAAYRDATAGPDISSDFTETTQRVISEFSSPEAQYAVCENVFNVPARGVIETRAVTSSIPTLVLAGTADLATPPAWSMLADESLPNSQYAEFAGLTHGLIGNNGCLNQITRAFLDTPDAMADQGCIVDLPGVDYEFGTQ